MINEHLYKIQIIYELCIYGHKVHHEELIKRSDFENLKLPKNTFSNAETFSTLLFSPATEYNKQI